LATVFAKCKLFISGPDIPLFKRFQTSWSKVNIKNFVPSIKESKIKQIFGDDLDDILISL